uniref:RRM domain-containing protein n=1 Tax=Oryza punctata TaxID=4537 RepID=A0A0E0JY93_ORYPU
MAICLPDEPGKVRQRSHLLELRGELLLASVLQEDGCTGGDGDRLSMSVPAFDVDAAVHALDPDAAVDDAEAELAVPAFAVEATRFGDDLPGGSAYFVVRSEPCRVYRYSFVDGRGGTVAATLVDTLPAGWNDERCMWFLPQPNIDPMEKEEDSTPASRRRRRRGLTIYVNDLSPKVDSCGLREMFSKHGKVVQARVAYDKQGR